MNQKKVIIDTDPGIDDALALMMAIASDYLDINVISAVFGNIDVDVALENIKRIFEVCKVKNMPVIAKGAEVSLSGQIYKPRLVHGVDGLGNVKFDVTHNYKDVNANDALKKCLVGENIDLLITLGPLTNIATLLIEEPAVKDRIKEMVIMGGSVFTSGNATEEAEFNFYQDPEAAKVVLNSKIPIKLISLDATRQLLFKSEIFKKLDFNDGELSVFIKNMLDFGLNYHKKYRNRDGIYLPDVLALCAVLDEDLFSYRDLSLDVDIDKERGKVFDNLDAANTIRFCDKVDVDGIINLFVNTINKLLTKRS
ncbi:MAG: nucleoside hydrolase [Candidatus Kappaea frigidicola]|nr:nucleoside hydrolase [Candidatus Kappaea frigidicola]